MKTDETNINWAHNPKVVGSSPTSATKLKATICGFFFLILKLESIQNYFMKKIMVSAFLIMWSANLFAQKNVKSEPVLSNPAVDFSHFVKTYNLAMGYNDLVVATQSVYEILSVDSTNLAWKDTLARLFLIRGAFDQAVFVGKELLTKSPDDIRLIELVAVSLQSAGNAKESLEYYEKLYPKTQNLYHLYQIIVLQYSLARLGECSANIDLLLKNPDSEKGTIEVNVGQGYTQKVPFKAAALNIKGVIAKQLNENSAAEALFNEALKVMPDFILPKGNLDDLKKESSKVPEQNSIQPKK